MRADGASADASAALAEIAAAGQTLRQTRPPLPLRMWRPPPPPLPSSWAAGWPAVVIDWSSPAAAWAGIYAALGGLTFAQAVALGLVLMVATRLVQACFRAGAGRPPVATPRAKGYQPARLDEEEETEPHRTVWDDDDGGASREGARQVAASLARADGRARAEAASQAEGDEYDGAEEEEEAAHGDDEELTTPEVDGAEYVEELEFEEEAEEEEAEPSEAPPVRSSRRSQRRAASPMEPRRRERREGKRAKSPKAGEAARRCERREDKRAKSPKVGRERDCAPERPLRSALRWREGRRNDRRDDTSEVSTGSALRWAPSRAPPREDYDDDDDEGASDAAASVRHVTLTRAAGEPWGMGLVTSADSSAHDGAHGGSSGLLVTAILEGSPASRNGEIGVGDLVRTVNG